MTDRPRRTPKPRKPHPYVDPDIEDPYRITYSRHNQPYFTNPSENQTHSLAKILVKFVNSTTKALQNNKLGNQKLQTPPNNSGERKKIKSYEKNTPKKINPKQTNYQIQTRKHFNKEETSSHHPNIKNQPPSQIMAPKIPTHSQNVITHPTQLLSQLQHSPTLFANMNQVGIMIDPIFVANLLNSCQNMSQGGNKFLKNNFMSQIDPTREQLNGPKEKKLFGRAAYHVAIAYHIHLKQTKQKGQVLMNDLNRLDPTTPARKLKESSLNGH